MGSQDTEEIEKMARKSNYADKPHTDDGYMPPGRLPVNFGSRTYDPTAGSDDGEGGSRSSLFENCLGGDWSWRPYRDKMLGDDFKTFLGVPKGMPEQLGRAREAAGERGALRYGNPVLAVRKYPKLIPGVNGGWFDTLAGSHVGNKLPRRVDIEVLGSDIDRSYSANDVYGEFCRP